MPRRPSPTPSGQVAVREFNSRGVHVNDINSMQLTRHAIERILEMALDPEEVKDAWLNGTPRPSTKYPGCTNIRHGRIVLGVGDGNRVMTVLWSPAYVGVTGEPDLRNDLTLSTLQGAQ